MVEDYSETEDVNPEETAVTDSDFTELTASEAYEEIRDIFSEIREIRNTKQFLETQNRELKEKMESLSSELDGMDIVISSAKNDIELTEQRTEQCLENINDLEAKQEMEIEIINNLQKSIKTVTEDNNKCLTMKEHLIVEFESIRSEKVIIFKKLKDMEEGLKKICGKKNALKVPYLRAYDALLKRVYHAFKEAENRMDVSLKLLH
jgi:chromosome segregation ATPase